MATSLLASVSAFGVNTTTTTPPIVTTGAGLITINLSGVGTATLSDSLGNTWTLAVTGGTNAVSRLYYCLSPTTGGAHTFTFTGTTVYSVISVQAWSNVTAYHTAVSTGGGASASGGNPGAITPSGFELFVSGYEKEGGSGDVYQVDSGFTISGQQPFTNAVNYGGAFAYKITTRAEDPFWSDNHGTTGRNGTTMAAFTIPTPTIAGIGPFVQVAVGVAAAAPDTVVVMPNDVTVGNWLIVCTANPGGGGTPTWTDTRGLTYTLRSSSINVSGGQSVCSIWTAPITSSGPNTITRTLGANYPVVMWVIEIDGFTGTPTIGASSGGASDFSTTVATGNVTAAQANNILVAVAGDSGGNPYVSISPTPDVSGLSTPGAAQGCFMAKWVPDGTYNPTFTKSPAGVRQSAAALLISFTPASHAAPLPTNI